MEWSCCVMQKACFWQDLYVFPLKRRRECHGTIQTVPVNCILWSNGPQYLLKTLVQNGVIFGSAVDALHPETRGRPRLANNSVPNTNRYSLSTFSTLDMAGERFWWRVPEMRVVFRINSFAVGNPRLPAPYFRLFWWRLGTLYALAPWGSCPAAGPPSDPALCRWSADSQFYELRYSSADK